MAEQNQPEESLRDLLEKEELEGLLGRDISIVPRERYDKEDFVEAMSDYTDLQGKYVALRKDNGDIGAMNDIARVLNPQNPNLILNRGLEGVLLAADTQLSASGKTIALYAGRNSLVNELSGEQLNALVLQLGNPNNLLLYKSNDKEHEKLAEIVRKMGIVQSGKIEELAKDIPDLMNSPSLEGVPAWHQALFARYSDDQSYVQDFLRNYASVINAIYAKAFTVPGKGKNKNTRVLNKTRLRDFYDENLKVAEDEMDREDDEKEKLKIWDKSIKPIDLMVAELFYGTEE